MAGMRPPRLPVLLVSSGVLFASAALSQQKDAAGSETQTRQTVVTPAGEVRVLSDDEARAVVARFRKLVLSRTALRGSKKKRHASFVTRLEEVEALSKVQHASLVPLLKRVLRKDPSDAVRVKAAEALRAQPKKDAQRLALQLIKERRFLKKGALAGPIIKILSYHGAPQSVWKDLQHRFLDVGSLGQQALFEHIGERKDWDMVPLILEHIDPPAPANVDDPNNPPATYWKERWEQWRAFKPQLKEACEKLFGREFETRKELADWIRRQGGLKALRKKAG